MLTDRCATMCLLVNLALLYPRATLLFQLSMSLDVASHWLHLHRSALIRGGGCQPVEDTVVGGCWDGFWFLGRFPFKFLCFVDDPEQALSCVQLD
jgi:hypothetical protein